MSPDERKNVLALKKYLSNQGCDKRVAKAVELKEEPEAAAVPTWWIEGAVAEGKKCVLMTTCHSKFEGEWLLSMRLNGDNLHLLLLKPAAPFPPPWRHRKRSRLVLPARCRC